MKTQLARVTMDVSKAIANELCAAGYVDAEGFITADGDEIGFEIIDPKNAARSPTIRSLSESSQNHIKNQLKVMRAGHAHCGDQVERNVLFFERFR